MPSALLLAAIGAFFAGVANAFQSPTNALLSRAAGSPILTALISFLVGTAAIACATLWLRPMIVPANFRAVPWYGWLGGFYGAFFVTVTIFAVPRLGAASLITLIIAGQLVAAVAIDHFGLLGSLRLPVSPARLVGVALVFAGVVLVRRP